MPGSDHDENLFMRKRRELDRREEYHLSDEKIGHLLGVDRKYVWKLSNKPDHEVRPVYVLALQYVIDHGVEATNEIIDPAQDHLRQVVGEIQMSKADLAHALGVGRSHFSRLCSSSHEARFKRPYVLALYWLHFRFGPDHTMRVMQEHAQVFEAAKA